VAADRIATFVQLRSLTLMEWEISSRLLTAVGRLEHLQHLAFADGLWCSWMSDDFLQLLPLCIHVTTLAMPILMYPVRDWGVFPLASHLTSLSLTGADVDATQIAPLRSLRHLTLDHCNLYPSSGFGFEQLRTLNRLVLNCGRVNDNDLRGVALLVDLEHLELLISPSNEDVTDAGLQHLSSLVHLKHLHLACGHLLDMFAPARGRDADLKLMGTKGLAFLGTLTELCHLSLRFPRVTFDDMRCILDMRHLRELHLECVGIREWFLLLASDQLRYLQVLSIAHCDCVSDDALSRLGRLLCLERVTLRRCRGFTDDGLDALREPRPPAGRVAVSPDTIGCRTGTGVVCQALRARGLVRAARALRCVSDNSVRLQVALLILVLFRFIVVSVMHGVTRVTVMVVGLVCVNMSAANIGSVHVGLLRLLSTPPRGPVALQRVLLSVARVVAAPEVQIFISALHVVLMGCLLWGAVNTLQ
jgi:hypothetical protein